MSDPQEPMEQLAGTPAGAKGDKGDRGERGLPRVEARAVVYLFLLNMVLIVVAFLYITHQATVNEQKWCTTIVTLDQADQKAPPPVSEFGRKLVTDFHRLRGSLGCS